MSTKDFIKGTEELVNPIAVGSIHFIQSFNGLLPKFIQKKLMRSTARKMPSMGFIVEPYSFFLCYEITDEAKASALLPDGFKLVKTRIFNDDKPKFYCILNCFRVHTSVFWGIRSEFYIIAEDESTGLLSWIIIDYDSDTIRYDAKNGLQGPSSPRAVLATDYSGDLVADINNRPKNRRIAFTAHLKRGIATPLDERLWLEGNLSVGYGRVLSDGTSSVFSLKFEAGEVVEALRIPHENLTIEADTWFKEFTADRPAELVCFPFAQHFISDSPETSSSIRDKEELAKAVEAVNFSSMPVFSERTFFKSFLVSGAVSFIITLILVILLILK